jgi:hypothetical protein
VLVPTGRLIQISFQQPHFRLENYLQFDKFNWSIKHTSFGTQRRPFLGFWPLLTLAWYGLICLFVQVRGFRTTFTPSPKTEAKQPRLLRLHPPQPPQLQQPPPQQRPRLRLPSAPHQLHLPQRQRRNDERLSCSYR